MIFAGVGDRAPAQGYSEVDGVRQKFTSTERDNETGLDYFASRYNASTQGRFTSADTVMGSVTNPQTLSLYAYVQNNPLKFIDPSGHSASSDFHVFVSDNPFTSTDLSTTIN